MGMPDGKAMVGWMERLEEIGRIQKSLEDMGVDKANAYARATVIFNTRPQAAQHKEERDT